MQIRTLFDPSKDIHRSIEKVITYGASQEARLKSEISEYIVTESIEEQFRKLLDRMQLAMETGGENEIGVWVSGFYGSGKSSFTKYLGFAFDNQIKVDGLPFIKHLQDRLQTAPVKAQLSTVVQRFPAAVVMLDLASDQVVDATMQEVSTVLYYKVLQWAGYSRNLKVAALERKLEKDGRFAEFEQKVAAMLPGLPWKGELQNDPLIVDGLVPQVAHEMYPALFPTSSSFSSNIDSFIKFENERVQEMIDIIREKSGKQYVLLIVDEVGQYVASRDNLILNLDGLAKNLKRLGDGKVWMFATAQQTLTEDDPRAALNSSQLYKLKDRFPIQIDLEAEDIKKICTGRLLGKSPAGADALGKLFDTHGQALRHNTKLQDAKYYDSDFSRDTFINLYPFLPAHFDILLHLLGALAKSTGGIGLRSAIKVIQDILVEKHAGEIPVADRPTGWLATTVTLFDALDKDIRRAFPSIHQAVGKVFVRFPDSDLHKNIAKTIAILQILANLPVTLQNVASLMHPGVDAASHQDEVSKAVEQMLNDPLVPLGEKDGSLTFLSEKLRDIEQERGNIPLRSVDIRRIGNEALREVFDPLPATRLHGSLAVTAGLKVMNSGIPSSLAGDRETIQTIVEFSDPANYDTARTRLVDESRQRSNQNTILLLGRTSPEADNLAAEIYRCQRIAELHRNDPDQEVKEYCASQIDRATTLANQLQVHVKRSLTHGSFVFRGQFDAVTSLDQELLDAAKKHLAKVAADVFNRYAEAPERVDTALAEKFLRVGNPAGINSALDPLGLVEIKGGSHKINTAHKAIVSLRDAIERNGTLEGKRLLEQFSDAPFGWSPDTVRYILAAMLVAGDLKLKISGREVIAAGQQAIDALKTNKSFGPIGVSLRESKMPDDVLARAAERLTNLIGDSVVPLEQEISKAAAKHFPRYQHDYSPLAEKLSGLGVAGVDRLRNLTSDIQDILLTDASDAPLRLGGEESPLYDNLQWAGDLKRTLENGLDATLRDLQRHRNEIQALPDSGVPGDLKRDLAEDLSLLSDRLAQESFYKSAADLATQLTNLQNSVRDAADKLAEQLKHRRKEGAEDLERLPEWAELNPEERASILSRLESISIDANRDLDGFKQLLSRDYEINTRITELKESVRRQGQEKRRQRIEDLKKSGKQKRDLPIRLKLTTTDQIDQLITQLQTVKAELAGLPDIEVNLTIKE
ncbi:BREX system P-loop protein BrxC [Sulfurisoma sediminicola]|uniref:Probable ATP-binding protein BrxC winged helix-turn-helix domain-containing protein n=1 Tax=Sulfurisoma sediminicola TaxID=1381557 RepID=A0A497XCU2_9PROT|nr:BREX system P-loop protein BrxC [Sulfurisoma sediminicola]RLJ64760.1 hypothetical protein DFR35_1406 [Sulfurisoma sediminicola]